jgi:hypothetical protein
MDKCNDSNIIKKQFHGSISRSFGGDKLGETRKMKLRGAHGNGCWGQGWGSASQTSSFQSQAVRL